MRFAACVGALGLTLALSAVTADAQAFEREWHVGGGAGATTGHGLELSPALGVYAAYGVSDVFDVRLELTARGYELVNEQNPHALSAMLGLAYKLDVLRWVPWAGVYAGYLGYLEPPVASTFQQHDAALALGLGLDYGISRQLGVGASVHLGKALTRSDNSTMDALFRVEYRWGW